MPLASLIRIRPSTLAMAAIIVTTIVSSPVRGTAQSSDTGPAIDGFDVRVDHEPALRELEVGLKDLMLNPRLLGTQPCLLSALDIAHKAVFVRDVWDALRSMLQNLVDGIRKILEMLGKNPLANLFKFLGALVESFNTDQPEAAMGRALVNYAADWAGDSTAVEEAKRALNDALFPGPVGPAVTKNVSIPGISYCRNITVTIEFKDGGGGRGALFVLVQGECDCTHAANLSKLRSFSVRLNLPMVAMDAQVKWEIDGTEVIKNVKELLESSKSFKEGVEAALNDGSVQEVPDLFKDLTEKADKASTITPTLVLTPHFAKPSPENVQVTTECGCPQDGTSTDGGGGTGFDSGGGGAADVDPRPIEERVCDARCGPLYDKWRKLEREAATYERWALDAKRKAAEVQAELDGLKQSLRDKQGRADEYRAEFKRRDYTNAEKLGDLTRSLPKLEEEIRNKQKEADAEAEDARNMDKTAKRLRQEADAAHEAYDRCVKACQKLAEDAKKVAINRTPALRTGLVSLLEQKMITEGTETRFVSARPPTRPLDGLLRALATWFLRPPTIAASVQPWPASPASRSRVAMRDATTASFAAQAVAGSTLALPDGLTIAIIATGTSSGEAFRLQAINGSGFPQAVSIPDGLVLQPLKAKAREVVQRLDPRTPGVPLRGYCLDFAKLPPSAGMLYRIADDAVQEQFAPLTRVLQSARSLAGQGLLHPDSDPAGYADSIKQWSLWSRIEKFDAEAFEQRFVGHTRKAVEAASQRWTKDLEREVRDLVPNRWRDILAVWANADRAAATGGR